jgi:hypothetical protein
VFHSTTATSTRPAPRSAWRVLGGLILADTALTFLGAGLDQGAPTLGAGQQEVVRQFAEIPLTTKVVGSYLEFLGVLVFLAWAMLAARLLSGEREISRWLSSTIAATAILQAALVSTALAVQVAATFDGHQGAAWQLLAVVNDAADVAFFGSLCVRGMFVALLAVAGLATRALPAWLCWLGIAVGLVGLVSPLGAGMDLQQLGFLIETAWLVLLAATSLARRRLPDVARQPADALTA